MQMIETKRYFFAALAILLAVAASPAFADPWAKPGDLALRHDVQLLADAGIIKSPVNTWPIPWATIAADLAAHDSHKKLESLDPAVQDARARVARRLDTVRGLTGIQPNARAAWRSDSFWTRNFEDTPREDAEVRAGLSWMGDRFAMRAQISFVAGPRPGDREWRGDGSYVAAVVGNHIVHAGALDRWWGPAHEDTLILSSNARPAPGLGIERNVAKPFEHRWLAWLGPWTYSYYWGFLESNREVPNARLMALRIGFRPLKDLEIGVSRTAQWCGKGRPCDARAFWDIAVGRTNSDAPGVTPESEAGNQLAAIDFRWQSPFTGGPWAVYGQATAEDEAGGFPSRYFAQFGGETWGTLQTALFSGHWRAHLEYTNTLVHFWQDAPRFGTAYNHHLYRTGYRHRGRAIGAGVDGDSEVLSAGLMLGDARERTWNGVVRYGTINRKANGTGSKGRHTVSPEALKIFGAQLTHRRPIRHGTLDLGTLSLGLGVQYADNRVTDASDTDVQAFVQWTWDYSGL